VKSSAAGVQEYLDSLGPEHREVAESVVAVIRAAMPAGFVESMTWGMPTWEVPLEVSGKTYNGKPLAYVSFAVQKRHYAVYLMALYADSAQESDFRARWSAPSGRALDMGKSCVRFNRLDDVDLPLIGASVAGVSIEEFLAQYRAARG
jgi:uncharacterized protein YdhG (YjbR/CyaY superfamily)